MSMTEHIGPFACNSTELSPEAKASLARIQELARKNRRQYAVEKSNRSRNNNKPAAARRPPQKPKPSKARKPYFFNPADRD